MFANPGPGYDVHLPRLPAIPIILVQYAADYEIVAAGGVSNPTHYEDLDKIDVEKDNEYQSVKK